MPRKISQTKMESKQVNWEGEFAAMNGWEAESDAATLLNGLGIATEYHYEIMKNLNGPEKVKSPPCSGIVW